MESISVLIDPRFTHSYATFRISEGCGLKGKKHVNSWLVQLFTCNKRKVSEAVKECLIKFIGFLIIIELNILPLGSYNSLIGMD